ncbi:TPA: protein-L-isoaspartate(D-aspartate) O-methyltransferase [Candidatus Woesearchaeota archaeon]|nr:protein-L-isoaspartate(D-aspartate) O-methyltransferase [Candidatus Woesearchaeota archaeon]
MQTKQELLDYWKRTGYHFGQVLLDAFKNIERKQFVLTALQDQAYEDHALPIGHGQTISQPTTVMLMLQALEVKKNHVVLEIGAGSGYNAALLSQLCKKVYTIEIVKEAASFAQKNLCDAGIKNVNVIVGDGSKGLPGKALFDRIVMTAASPEVPRHLLDQLKDPGILVAPVGVGFTQEMIKMVKNKGNVNEEGLGFFSFVPLTGAYGSDKQQ